MDKVPEKYAEQAKRIECLTIENGEIDGAEFVPENHNLLYFGVRFRDTPAHFILHITLHSEADSRIGVTVGLPAENWNGKFIGFGNGGAAGFTDNNGVRRGVSMCYAAAHTDMGTAPRLDDCVGNWVALRDFGYRSTHMMTVAGKALTEAFYGKAPTHSYFHGGSTGGQQALVEAQRYPEDYDGILCCFPAYDRVRLHTQFLWNLGLMNYGDRLNLSKDELKAVNHRLVEEYAARCGAAPGDRFLPYPDQIGDIDYSIFQDEKMTTPLSDFQVEILRKIYAGPTDPVTGEQIYEGFTPGAELQSLGLVEMNDKDSFIEALMFPFIWAYGREMDFLHFDFHRDYQRAIDELSSILDADSRDLSAFRDCGGKMILLHGTADAAIPFANSLRYYRDVVKKNGGLENTLPFFRYFLAPGFAHSFGGSGFQDLGQLDFYSLPQDALHDPIVALDEWAAEGRAPEMMIETAYVGGSVLTTEIEKQRPVYRYPYRTRYVSGDPSKPESFCRIESE